MKNYIELLFFLVNSLIVSTDVSKIGVTYVIAKSAWLWLTSVNFVL